MGDSIYTILNVPKQLHDLMDFADVRFRHKRYKDAFAMGFAKDEELRKLDNWSLCLPTNTGKEAVIPLPEKIDEEDPEGHWRAILSAAADFQYLVNSGQYVPA